MHRTLLVIALLTAAASPAFTQTRAKTSEENNIAEQAVLKVTQEWLAADERQDRAALNSIIADDFLGTGPRGTIVSKRDILPREGTSSESHGLSISSQDVKVRVFGETAIVTGRGVPKIQQEERPELRFTVVFVHRANNWQMVGAHLSPIPRE